MKDLIEHATRLANKHCLLEYSQEFLVLKFKDIPKEIVFRTVAKVYLIKSGLTKS